MIGAIWRALGVDPEAHAVLHRTFWDLSRRGGSALIAKRGDIRRSSMRSIVVSYGLLGLFVGATAFMPDVSTDGFATQVCGAGLLLLTIAIVADFASVVVAPGDDEVLFHLPISSRTYLAARTTVAGLHTAQMAAVYGAAPAILAAIRFHNLYFAAALFVAVMLSGWFALILSFVLYRAALRLLGGDRLRTTLAYLPGIISLVAALGPQLLLAQRGTVAGTIRTWKPLGDWALFFPPAWFSGLATLTSVTATPVLLARAAWGLLALPLGAFLLLRARGGSFLADLIRLVSAKDAGPRASLAGSRPLAPGKWTRRLLGIRSPEAAAGYLLTTGAFRSRESKARTFPLLLMPLAIAVLGLMRRGATDQGILGPLFAIYFLGAGAGTLVSFLPYHEHRDAGWLHEALPIERFGRYYLGVIRAVLLRLVGPWMAVLFASAIACDVSATGIGLAFHAVGGSLLAIPIYAATEEDPPFSRVFVPGDNSGRFGLYALNIGAILLIAGVGAAFAQFAPIGLAFSGPLFALVFVLWMRAIGRRLDRYPPAFLRAAASGSATAI